MSDALRWLTDDLPELRDPVLLIALDGFVDAGEVGESAALFLRHRWLAERVAELDGDTYLDYRARRPTAVVDAGVVNRVEWPRIELSAARLDGPRDAVLLIGPEPDMRWRQLVDDVAEACRRLGVRRAVTLGAYPAAAPHTRPVTISYAGNAADDGAGAFEATAVGGYSGPVGAATALQAELAVHGVAVLGLFAEVPHYIAASPYPPGSLAMVRAVADLLEVDLDTDELETAARLHAERVDEAISEHDEAAEMVAGLEQLRDEGGAEPDLPSGDDLADEIERFLGAEE